MSRKSNVEELEFDVPYGEVHAKAWGKETLGCKRILAIHGWLDNCGSFDHLFPLLEHKDGLYIVAIDLPGHGKSSQLSKGAIYNDLSLITEIRRIVKELNWNQPICSGENDVPESDEDSGYGNDTGSSKFSETSPQKFSIIAHSYGAFLGAYYCSLFPDDVEEIMLIDFLKSKSRTPEEVCKNAAKAIDNFLESVPSPNPFSDNLSQKKLSTSRIISYEAGIEATIASRKAYHANLSREEAACLLKRSTIAINTPPNSVIYTLDLRLNCMINVRETRDLMRTMIGNINCHVICLSGRNGLYSEDKLFMDEMDDMQVFLKSRARSFNLQWLDGDHYPHMGNCKNTATIINNYLKAPLDYMIL